MVILSGSSRLPLLGCNVYISAGGLPHHARILMDLLKGTMDRCTLATASDNACVVVHAFSDVVYNRSSIHLAGTESSLPGVVSSLVKDAKKMLGKQTAGEATASEKSSHPFVGLVDHVSVMPLLEPQSTSQDNLPPLWNIDNSFQPTTPWGRAAREIGTSIMDDDDVTVHWYGHADAQDTPLAEVRRRKTQFFHSGGLATQNPSIQEKDTATVGAPPRFVENYNVRLLCGKKTAQSLTRAVRERDGGLPGVEALTLPYGKGRFEVACNLTRPSVGSAAAIDKKVEEWMAAQEEEDARIETSYRVGTTAEQCLQVLGLVLTRDDESIKALQEHNKEVQRELQSYLSA